eukprot:247779_1
MTLNHRKKRAINNPLVDIENVSIQAGCNNINWICVAREKLREREIKLLKKRLNICNSVINSSIKQFTLENTQVFNPHKHKVHIYVNRMQDENYKAYNELTDQIDIIINICDQHIKQQLSQWKGYKSSKQKNTHTFQDYFKGSRRWFDMYKIRIIAKYFLVPLFHIIYQFATNAAAEFFCNTFFDIQKLYVMFLSNLILINLFGKKMKLPNTRELYVITAQTYRHLHIQNAFHTYIKSKTDIVIKGKRKQRQATHIRTETIKIVKQEYNICKLQFQSELLALHYPIDNYKCENMPQYVNSFNDISSMQMTKLDSNMYSFSVNMK